MEKSSDQHGGQSGQSQAHTKVETRGYGLTGLTQGYPYCVKGVKIGKNGKFEVLLSKIKKSLEIAFGNGPSWLVGHNKPYWSCWYHRP